jgi:hypothetical protein
MSNIGVKLDRMNELLRQILERLPAEPASVQHVPSQQPLDVDVKRGPGRPPKVRGYGT